MRRPLAHGRHLGAAAWERVDLRNRGEKVRSDPMSFGTWPDAAYGDQSSAGKFRLGCAIGLMSSTLSGPRHILQCTSKFSRELVNGILGGALHALSDMVDHMMLL